MEISVVFFSIFPAICRAVRPQNSKFSGSKEVRWGPAARKRPIGEGSLYIDAGSGKILSHLY
nr:hypothetical protein [Bacillus thuringiensis]